MDNLVSEIIPNSKTISPITINKPEVQNVPENNNLHRRLNYAIAPEHNKYTNKLCSTLSPSPKNNITTDPACSNHKNYPNRPFKRDECYMVYSQKQNIWGPVCGDGFGSNGNWTRGNNFAVDYDGEKLYNKPDYAVNVPNFKKKNSLLVSDSPFYPFPDYNVRNDPEYKSYSYVDNYIKGKPVITYPYFTVETFENIDKGTYSIVLNVFLLMVVLCIFYKYFN